MKIAVVGAGITGVMATYYLSKRGHQVDVYDQEKSAALKCSYANGGQLSVSNSEVWNNWSTIYRGVKWLFNSQAPLLIRPKFDLDQISWLMKFVTNTIKNTYTKNTARTILMGLESRALYQEIIDRENIEFDHKKSGILHIYKDERYWRKAQQAEKIYSSNHCEWQLLTDSQILDLEPALENCQGIIGGAYTKDDAVGDIHKFCVNLLETCVRKYQAKWLPANLVQDIRDLASVYDVVVVSAGVDSKSLAAAVGDKLDIYPVKGYSITINDPKNQNQNFLPKVSLLDDQTKIVSSTLGNRFRVAGTAELNGINYEVDPSRIAPLFRWVENNFPKVSTENYSMWSCLRPMTPDMMPIVCRSDRHKKIFYHTGHGHLGWTLSPSTAIMLTTQIENIL